MTKLGNFFNPVSNNNRLFTAEEVGAMSPNEFAANEKAIDYQMTTLGVPRNADLAGNSDVIYVHEYTRSDGTKVRAHYRSKHGGTLTGAAAMSEHPKKADFSELRNFNFANNILIEANNRLNKDYPDAREMANIFLSKPNRAPQSEEYKYISPGYAQTLNEKYGLDGTNKKIGEDWSGIVYSKYST